MNPFVLQPDPHYRRRLVLRGLMLGGAVGTALGALAVAAVLIHTYDAAPAAARRAAPSAAVTAPAVAASPAPARAAASDLLSATCAEECPSPGEAEPQPFVLEPLVVKGTVVAERRDGRGRARRPATFGTAARPAAASNPAPAARRELTDAELQKLLDGE